MVEKANLCKHKLLEIAKEVEILRDLDHPNIVKVLEGYVDRKYLYIVTEFVKGGELFDEIIKRKHFTEED